MANCGNCVNWKMVDVVIGHCSIYDKHTTEHYGDECPKWSNTTVKLAEPVKQNTPAPITLYSKALKYALQRGGQQISTTTLKMAMRCTWLESAALIDKLASDGIIKKL